MASDGPPPRAATTGFERRSSTGFSPRFGMSVTARRRAGDESPRVLGAADPGGRDGPGGDGVSLGPGQEAGDGPVTGDERERRGLKGLPGPPSGTPTTYLNARLRSQVSAVWSQRGWPWGRPSFLQGILKGDPEARARLQGRLLLLAVAFLWGSYGVIARDIFLLPHPPPVSIFTFFRKLIAASSFFVIEAFSGGGLDAAPSESRQMKQAAAVQAKEENALLDLERNGGPSDGTPAVFPRSLSTSGRMSGDPRRDASPSVREFFGSQRRLRRVAPVRWKLPPLFLPALELGLWQFLGTAFQALGLENTSATRAGFVVQTTNVLVPIISFLSGDSILPTTWLAALLAMAGVVTMGLASEDGGNAGQAAIIVETQAGMGIKQAAGISVGQGDVTTHTLPLFQEAQRRLLALAQPDGDAVQAAPIPGAMGSAVGTPPEANALAQGPVSSAASALASASDGALLGDVEVLFGALFYSLATVRLSRFLRQHKPYELSAATMLSAAVFAGGWALFEVAAAEASGKGALSLFEGWVDQPGTPPAPPPNRGLRFSPVCRCS